MLFNDSCDIISTMYYVLKLYFLDLLTIDNYARLHPSLLGGTIVWLPVVIADLKYCLVTYHSTPM